MAERERRRRPIGALLCLVVMAATLVGGASPAGAQQDDGLRLTAETVYRVLGDEEAVEVEITYSATNLVADRRQGFQIIQTFFTSIFEAIPKDAVDIVARRDNGTELSVTRVSLTEAQQEEFADSPFDTWEIDLGPNLFFQQTRNLTLTFRLPDGGHRNVDAWARVNPALASFPVVARGDAGRSAVRVEFPPGFEVETFGEPVERTEAFGATVLVADEIESPFDWFVVVVGSSDFGLSRRSIEVDGIDGELSIASWPGDEDWDAFVERGLREGLPILQEVIGTPWPVGDQLEIREAIAPALAGYGGWYYEPPETDEDDAAIDVGEYLEMDLLGHEFAHAWFNDDLSRSRWFLEGLSEYFGVLMARELGDDVVEFDDVTRRGTGNIALVDWLNPSFLDDPDEVEERERWAYAASYQVIDELADEIGLAGLTATLQSLFAASNPYAPALDDPGPARADWRDIIDAFELVGGSEDVEEIFVEWVLQDFQADELAERAAAQVAASALAEAEPGWAVPEVVYEKLANWRFDDVESLAAELAEVAAAANAVRDDAASLELAVPTEPQESYESVEGEDGDIAAVAEAIAEQHEAVTALIDATARTDEPTSWLEDVGLWGTDLDATLEDARGAFEAGDYAAVRRGATEINDALDDAESVGRGRAIAIGGVALGLVLLLLVVVTLLRRRRRRRRAGEDEPMPPTADDDQVAEEAADDDPVAEEPADDDPDDGPALFGEFNRPD